MALYDGFFDYDKEYDSGDFTGYFGEIVGSGVCIHEDENSMKVSWNGSTALIAPGFLFIRGYWLRNRGSDYAVPLSGQGVHAILAYLNMGIPRIVVEVRPKADPEVYPDALVLAYVTIDSTGAATVEDTRYNTDICGIIDSAGGLSSKVEYAINYIDNEVDDKLKEAEEAIEAQSLRIDEKIEEVNMMLERLAPPPIGTVKFSASTEIEDGWLRCDGSFINEADYPELVAALGKVTPTGEEFVEKLGLNSAVINVSNLVMFNQKAWVFAQASGAATGTLYGVDSSGVTKVSVSGVGGLIVSTLQDTVLSICGGYLFLAQSTSSASSYTLLQSAFTGSENSIAMEDVSSSIRTQISSKSLTMLTLAYPQVVYTNAKFYLALGYLNDQDAEGFMGEGLSGVQYTGYAVGYVSWGVSDIANCSLSYQILSCNDTTTSNRVWEDLGEYGWKNLLGFSEKTDSEMVVPFVQGQLITGTNGIYRHNLSFSAGSIPVNAIGNPKDNFDSSEIYFFDGTATTQPEDPYYKRFEVDYALRPRNSRPIVGDGICLWSAYLETSGKVEVTWIPYGGDNLVSWITTVPTPPSRAKLFPDSFCYASLQGIWFIFLGTGLLFSAEPMTSNWGYLDTTGVLGTITSKGSIHYDPVSNLLYVSGLDSTGVPKLGCLQMSTLYDFSNDGAFLPTISSDGVPAYIKAKEPEGGT